MTMEKDSLENSFWAKTIPTPGVEPGPSGWKPDILAVRPRGMNGDIVVGKKLSVKTVKSYFLE